MNIYANNITKKYFINTRQKSGLIKNSSKELTALNNITFKISNGEIVGLIGLNGAGKSTLIKILCGVLYPTNGSIKVTEPSLEISSNEFKKKMGVIFGHRGQLWRDLIVKDSFELLRQIYEIPKEEYYDRMKYFDEKLELGELIFQPLRKLSLGQKMKCEIAASMLHFPEFLLLDEPTIGLDIITREKILNTIKDLQKDIGNTIILTSHNLLDIENLCNRVMILDKGSIIFNDSIQKIKKNYINQYMLTIYLGKTNFDEDIVRQEIFKFSNNMELNNNQLLIFLPSENSKDISQILDIVGQITEIDYFEVSVISFEEIIKQIYREGMVYS